MKNYLCYIFFLISLSFLTQGLKAQTKITGIVTDSLTGETLPFISIQLEGSALVAMTDNSGKFTLNIPQSARLIVVSSIGYKTRAILISTIRHNQVKIQLAAASYTMSEVVVKPKKRKYTKKGNPAVDFVQKVIRSKDQHSPFNKEYYQYEHDERINIALNNFQQDKNKKLLHKYSFLTNYVDMSKLSGKPFLPISTKELVEEYSYQKSPRTEKRTVLAKRNSGLDEMLSEDGVQQILGEVFTDVDIYENNINLFLRPFVSPLSVGATDFYKYYLMDTVFVGGERCADLGFVPFSSQSPGFTGHLYITLDSTYFVKKVKLNFPKDINLNFIQDMSIGQEFNRAPDGTRLLMRDDMEVEFSVLSISNGFYARRTNRYSHHTFDNPTVKARFKEQSGKVMTGNTGAQPDSFWIAHSPDTVNAPVKSVGTMMRQLRNDPTYYISEKVFSALVTGYIETAVPNNKITLGPVYSTLSSNTVEGVRLRLGGLTTANLNDHWFTKGYLAYGTRDRKAKYMVGLEYSFDRKKKQANEFPIHSVSASYSYEINRLGQQYSTSADNVLLSWKRQQDDKITYQRKVEVNYNREFLSQFSYGLDVRYHAESATPYLPFVGNTVGNNIDSYSMGEAQFRLRYAPGERIYETPLKR